jgi:hypothetical protein
MENLIVPKNDLALKIKTDSIRTKIIERVSKFENLQSYRNNQELLVLICNSIEHLVSKGTKISKLDLAISICDNLFVNLTEEEKDKIKDTINFIHQNGFIKRIPYYKLFCVSAFEYFKSKKKVL